MRAAKIPNSDSPRSKSMIKRGMLVSKAIMIMTKPRGSPNRISDRYGLEAPFVNNWNFLFLLPSGLQTATLFFMSHMNSEASHDTNIAVNAQSKLRVR